MDDIARFDWNALRTLLDKENFIYVADCKLRSQKNLDHIAQNGGLFSTIVPKDRKEVKRFYQHLKENHVEWEHAFDMERSRKKGKLNVYKAHEAETTKKGYRIIFVRSSAKQEDDAKKDKRKSTKP
jgi:hypothetical protein